MSASPARPSSPEAGAPLATRTSDRVVLGGATVALTAILSLAAGVTIKAQNLTFTRPGQDGDMFASGQITVVLACVVIGLPTLIFAAQRFLHLFRHPHPAPVAARSLVIVTAGFAAANLAAAAVSWWAVSQEEWYRPNSILRAQDAVFTAGAWGVVATLAVGVAAVLAVRATRPRS